MMESFSTYFEIGLHHILDVNGLDHVIFLIVLAATYKLKEWKPLLWAVTAFTLAHTITLVMVSQGIGSAYAVWVEFLIPVTILLTALYNTTAKGLRVGGSTKIFFAALFGLIHGMGFGAFFGMMTAGSSEFWWDLIPFTLGIEVGQVLVVLGLLILRALLTEGVSVKPRDWILFLSGSGFGVALLMMVERWPF
jgi:hypothetical protein